MPPAVEIQGTEYFKHTLIKTAHEPALPGEMTALVQHVADAAVLFQRKKGDEEINNFIRCVVGQRESKDKSDASPASPRVTYYDVTPPIREGEGTRVVTVTSAAPKAVA